MVLRVDSGDFSVPAMTPTPFGSLASCDDHIEGGYCSQEDKVRESASKFNSARTTRSSSQCDQPSHRQWSDFNDGNFRNSIPSSSPPADDERRNNPSLLKTCLAVAFLAVVATLSVICHRQRSQLFALRHEIRVAGQHRGTMERTRVDILTQLASCEKSVEQYRHTHEQMQKVNQRMNEPMNQLRADYDQSVWELERLQAVEKRVKLSEGRWDTYVERVRDNSKRSVMEKFGKGLHSVELQVQLPSSPTPEAIRIELAPLDVMPHSVHTFLEQVDQGAWDGAAFDAHAGHVLMASDSDVSDVDCSRAPPPTILFPEFSAQYPHDRYTVAFPGRPSSSPDFYINLQSNAAHHSPRISGDEYLEGEPCFGKIVDEASRRVVDRMDKLSAGEGAVLKHKVLIKSARIIGR